MLWIELEDEDEAVNATVMPVLMYGHDMESDKDAAIKDTGHTNECAILNNFTIPIFSC